MNSLTESSKLINSNLNSTSTKRKIDEIENNGDVIICPEIGSLTDVIIVYKTIQYKCHKSVLSIASIYFRSIFIHNNSEDKLIPEQTLDGIDIITIPESKLICNNTLECFLRYMYTKDNELIESIDLEQRLYLEHYFEVTSKLRIICLLFSKFYTLYIPLTKLITSTPQNCDYESDFSKLVQFLRTVKQYSYLPDLKRNIEESFRIDHSRTLTSIVELLDGRVAWFMDIVDLFNHHNINFDQIHTFWNSVSIKLITILDRSVIFPKPTIERYVNLARKYKLYKVQRQLLLRFIKDFDVIDHEQDKRYDVIFQQFMKLSDKDKYFE